MSLFCLEPQNYYLFSRVWEGSMCTHARVRGGGGHFWEPPSILWKLGLKPRSSGLEAGDFTLWAICQVPFPFIGTLGLEAVSASLPSLVHTPSHLAVSHAGQACSGASVFGLGFLSFHSWEALHGSLLDSLAPLLRTVFSSASPGTLCPLPLLCFSFVAPLSLTYNYRSIAGPLTLCSSSVVVWPRRAIQSLGNALGISESSLNKNPDSRERKAYGEGEINTESFTRSIEERGDKLDFKSS